MKFVINSLIGLSLLLACPVIHAQVRKGDFRLGLDAEVINGFIGETTTAAASDGFDGIAFGVGLASPGILGGYSLTDRLVLGGRVVLARVDNPQFYGAFDAFHYSLLPFIEYMFLKTRFRPFVMGVAGIEGYIDDQAGDTQVRVIVFKAGAGGGGHLFLAKSFSLDFTGLFSISAGGGGIEEIRSNTDLDLWRFDFSLLFGLSGWL